MQNTTTTSSSSYDHPSPKQLAFFRVGIINPTITNSDEVKETEEEKNYVTQKPSPHGTRNDKTTKRQNEVFN